MFKQLGATVLLGTSLAIAAPLVQPAQAAVLSYTTPLSGAQEVPPNASQASGLATGSLTGDPDNWVFTYDLDFADLTAGLILAHIHVATGDMPRASTGPVVHDLLSPPLGSTSGNIMGQWTAADLPDTILPETVYQRFLDGAYYFNLHSDTPEFAAPGEIRGQIEFDSAAVPEPAAWLGLLAIGAIATITGTKTRAIATH